VQPDTRYAQSGPHKIAYQVVGDGPKDLILVPGFTSHVDYFWEEPGLARVLRNLASFSRLILTDKRGSGLSDRTVEVPTLEERMDDLTAVLDAVGSKEAVLLAWSDGGPMSLLFAASHPDRTAGLILVATTARFPAGDDYPEGIDPEALSLFGQAMAEDWGSGVGLWMFAPSMQDSVRFQQWWARYQRAAASPNAVAGVLGMEVETDARHVLSAVRVPTLIFHRTDDLMVPVTCARYMAKRIPGARYVEIPGSDHMYWTGDTDPFLDEVERLLTGAEPTKNRDRSFSTVMFTDIVQSTELAGQLGDQRWKHLLAAHDQFIRAHLDTYQGREIKSLGDGFLATFDGPVRGVRCAAEIAKGIKDLGIRIRVGLHAGECVEMGTDIGGVTVHVAARVADAAGAGEVLITDAVKGLVAGAGISVLDRGTRTLKGVPDPQRLFALQPAAAG
jgi:pimeloyl-ACP methyl ester carboxylesterase